MFKLVSEYSPTGDQPQAIKQLVEGINDNVSYQTLLGATGTGKTFTVANVIKEVNKPTLILSHNKTLAAQLYSEFKQFFPDNLVEYFVSYYDYYQPEAFIPTTGTYIEKDLSINDNIEKLRISSTSALLSGRKDVVVVSSVSCIYGMGNPKEIMNSAIEINVGDKIMRNKFLHELVSALYVRANTEFERGQFRVNGDTIDIFLAYTDYAVRIVMWDDEIESIESIDPQTGDCLSEADSFKIFPANLFVSTQATQTEAIEQIQYDLQKQLLFLEENGKRLEAERLKERVENDIIMLQELGYCSGIENYSRYMDKREPGERPFCLLDYFPDDFMIVIDESHVTVPQIRAMYGGDRSRKINLVEYGFRLPAAMDNRPLKMEEFESLMKQAIFVSATPADYELQKSEGVLVDQVIRPTGLLDPIIDVRPSHNQIDDLIEEIQSRIKKEERTLVTTLTKRMAEELNTYLTKMGLRSTYLHSDIDTIERVEILQNLRKGLVDVLIGVNLLREGLDLPEVSLVAILDADKEGFLRSTRSLTQTAGRAARNINGYVIMYADKITDSMQRTIDETNRRREKQLKYNEENNITPQALVKKIDTSLTDLYGKRNIYDDTVIDNTAIAADPVTQYMTAEDLKKSIENLKQKMSLAAQKEDFDQAIALREEIYTLEKLYKSKN